MITLEKSKRVFWVFAGVVVLIVVVIVFSIVSDRSARREFISKIPYYTTEFTIVYSKEKDQIYVNALKEPYEENRKKADDWIKSNGQNPQNLKLIYYPSNVFKQLNK